MHLRSIATNTSFLKCVWCVLCALGFVTQVCASCTARLRTGKVPFEALANFDAGSVPTHLEPLTHLESLLVSPLRPYRNVFVMRGNAPAWRTSDTFNRALRGHVIAFENADPQTLAGVFPLRPEDIPQHVQVVLLSASATPEEARRKLSACAALRVRGPVVAAWAQHLANVYRDKPFARLDDAVVRVYNGMNGVPEQLLAAAITAPDDDAANTAQAAFMEHRDGYCTQRYGSTEESDAYAAQDDTGLMAGLDGVELDTSSARVSNIGEVLSTSARASTADELIRNGGKIAVCTGKDPFSDYRPEWFLLVHPSAFPNGVGCSPSNGELQRWCKTILQRYPRKQYGGNSHLVLDMFNILQRHKVRARTLRESDAMQSQVDKYTTHGTISY